MKEYKVGEKFKFQDMPLVVVETKKPTNLYRLLL